MLITGNEHKSWDDFLSNSFIQDELNKIEEFLNKETYYPNKQNILRFLKLDLLKMKYVLYGQDPYIGLYLDKDEKKQPIANGRSFEPNNYSDWNDPTKRTSLNNILKAIYYAKTNNTKDNIRDIRNAINNKSFLILQPHQLFNSWESQGILMLNYALTVGNTAGSHIEKWTPFANELLEYMINKNHNLGFILWGKESSGICIGLLPPSGCP